MEIIKFIQVNKFYYHESRDKWYSTLQKYNQKFGETTYYTIEQLYKLFAI